MSLRDHDSAYVTGLSLLFEQGFLAPHRLSPTPHGAYSDYALIDVVAVPVTLPYSSSPNSTMSNDLAASASARYPNTPTSSSPCTPMALPLHGRMTTTPTSWATSTKQVPTTQPRALRLGLCWCVVGLSTTAREPKAARSITRGGHHERALALP